MESLHENISDYFEKYFEGLITKGEALQAIAQALEVSKACYQIELERKKEDLLVELSCLESI